MRISNTDRRHGLAIFVVNAGSSSVKYKRFLMREPDDYEVTHEGKVTRVGEDSEESLAFLDGAEEPTTIPNGLNHEGAIEYILKNSIGDAPIHVVGNRVVHGRDISKSCLINEGIESVIEGAITIAPVHNPYALKVIRAMRAAMPDTPQVATFDTSLYVDMPPENTILAIPYSYYEDYGIQRYGFHGTSHRYVAGRVAQYFGRPLEELRMVTCHKGNGTSITVWRDGKAVNTSMSFTPTAGTIMGSRCGDLDPGIVLYMIEIMKKTPEQVKDILNNKSGILGISGVSNDIQILEEAMATGGDPDGRIEFALDLYSKSVRKYIVQYVYEELGGEVDSVVFTAGIGEHADDLRERRIVQRLPAHLRSQLGNASREINDPPPASKKCFLIVHTDEELMIAQDAFHLVT